jgi:hypothetical protein
MSFQECVDRAVEFGELGQKDGDRLKRDFERLRDRHAEDTPGLADAQAKADLLDMLKAENRHNRFKAKLAMNNIKRTAADVSSYRTAGGRPDIARAAAYKLENYGEAPYASVAGRINAVTGAAHARLAGFLDHFRRGALGGDPTRHNKARLENVARELHGEATGDELAKQFAAAVADTFEWLRKRFNAAGGAIGKLESFGMPQRHDARALRNQGLTAWKAYITPRLDPSKMRHPLSGKPIGERELDGILNEIFDTITTEGWSKREPSRQAFGKGALANQRAEHRFLVFKDATAWLEYQRDFGSADIYGTITGHISMMAKDIGAMEVLGPNPAGTIEWLKQAIAKEAAQALAGQKALTPKSGNRARSYATKGEHQIDGLWKSIRGDLETPVNGFAADAFGTARALISAASLGGAALTSLSDLGTGMVARMFAGLPASHALAQVVKGFTRAERKEAVSAGLILDAALHGFHERARFEGSFSGRDFARYLNDRVLTVSGLLPWTQAGRHAFGLAFMAEAARRSTVSFAELPPVFREVFARHGFTAGDWEKIRKARLHEKWDGTRILRPAEIAERIDPKLADRYVEMVQAETEFAVPTGGHRARMLLMGQSRPGTLSGEIARSFAQFKSFGVAFMFLHGARVARMIAADRASGQLGARGAGYAGALLLSTTLFGAAALQLKQIAAGRDPRDMASPEFWGGAMLQGGALGIWGDFLFSDLNRFGGGIVSTIAGPLAGRLDQLRGLTIGNVAQGVEGDKTSIGREAVRFLKTNLPFGNVWYIKLAWEREVLDQLQFLADPEANKAFKRQQQFWKKDFGQEFYWAPGETAPARGPDFSTAFGG